ncbi:cytidine deaminase [candidate division WOR-3 bacterium]|nr:cytidine deaminase [candidate division WOR-3 bacterium]
MNSTQARLVAVARRASARAYAPFSGFKVGAAVMTDSGRVYSGCNVENSSLGLTICAERVAVFRAVAAGGRVISAVAVYADTPELTVPCGACLQVINEFGDNPAVILGNGRTSRAAHLRDLLPRAFRLGRKPS